MSFNKFNLVLFLSVLLFFVFSISAKAQDLDDGKEALTGGQNPPAESCVLVAVGMSETKGPMYGEPNVASYEDHRSLTGGQSGGQIISWDSLEEIADDGTHCALDVKGECATKRESEFNFNERKLAMVDGKMNLGVTSTSDKNKLYSDFQKRLNENGDDQFKGKSNEEISMSVSKNGTTIIPGKSEQEAARKLVSMEVFNEDGSMQKIDSPTGTFVPPNGSTQRMQGGMVYQKNTIVFDADDKPTMVTDDCRFLLADEKTQNYVTNPDLWPQKDGIPQMPKFPIENLDALLQGRSFAKPPTQAMSDGTNCYTVEDPVCGEDGKTYQNECFATHNSPPVVIASVGACASDTSVAEAATENISQNLVGKIIEALISAVRSIF